jgi:hypothetical protein
MNPVKQRQRKGAFKLMSDASMPWKTGPGTGGRTHLAWAPLELEAMDISRADILVDEEPRAPSDQRPVPTKAGTY